MDLTQSEEPWATYAALVDLENLDPADGRVRAARERLTVHPFVGDLIASLDTWPTQPLDGAYDPKDAIWVLSVIADFGMRRDDPRIAAIAERLLAAQAEDGGFLHGGFDHTERHPGEQAKAARRGVAIRSARQDGRRRRSLASRVWSDDLRLCLAAQWTSTNSKRLRCALRSPSAPSRWQRTSAWASPWIRCCSRPCSECDWRVCLMSQTRSYPRSTT